MKILRQGVKPEYVWRGSCRNCGCLFQLEEDDEWNIERDRDCNSYFKCPCCGTTVKISTHDVREPMDWLETGKDGEQNATD